VPAESHGESELAAAIRDLAYQRWQEIPGASGAKTADFTLYALDLGDEKDDLREWRLERFAAFDADQSRAVALFLRFMGYHLDDTVDYLAARSALKSYWGRFEAGGQDGA
jgi:hypothetical protein